MFLKLLPMLVAGSAILSVGDEMYAACVWKVTGANGGTLYLGGSIHALKSTDYPLPSAYNKAFDACSRLAFEVEPEALRSASSGLMKEGQYPRNDSLKNHVDSRTYNYLRRLFAITRVPEERFSRYKSWFVALALQSGSLGGASELLGVEEFLTRRAKANNKPIVGLESAREHLNVFSGLNDRQSEALLLLTLIPAAKGSAGEQNIMDAWRKGDADAQTRITLSAFSDFPSLGERVLTERNRNWMPKIESYLHSGKNYFVVAGAAHMGGSNGLLALLRNRGYQIEQL